MHHFSNKQVANIQRKQGVCCLFAHSVVHYRVSFQPCMEEIRYAFISIILENLISNRTSFTATFSKFKLEQYAFFRSSVSAGSRGLISSGSWKVFLQTSVKC